MALNGTDRDEIVALTQRLVRIPSQYIEGDLVQHAEIAEDLAAYMRESGLDVRIEEPLPDYPVVIGSTGPRTAGRSSASSGTTAPSPSAIPRNGRTIP